MNKHPGSPWPRLDDELRRLWNLRRPDQTRIYPTRQIAVMMGVSYNSVTGRAHRIGLSRPSPIPKPEQRRPPAPRPIGRGATLPPLPSELAAMQDAG